MKKLWGISIGVLLLATLGVNFFHNTPSGTVQASRPTPPLKPVSNQPAHTNEALAQGLIVEESKTPLLGENRFQIASGRAVIGKKIVPLIISEGQSNRVLIPLKQKVSLNVVLTDANPSEDLVLRFPHGGKGAFADGTVRTRPSSTQVEAQIEFTPTLGPGAYLVELRQGPHTVVVDLWAGPEHPVGKPGPKLAAIPSDEIPRN
jgi:hypothetical protein